MSRRKRNHSAAHQRLHLINRPARLTGAASPLESDSEPVFATSGDSQPDACLDDRPAAEHVAIDEPPGVALRRAREAAGLSLDAVSRTTKIGKSTLVAIESSDVLRLPAEIYTRGFVKSYAAEVGLPPDRTADDYLDRIDALTTHHVSVANGELPAPADRAHGHPEANSDSRRLLAGNQMRQFGRLTTLAAGIGLVVYLATFNRPPEGPESSLATPPETAISDATRTGGAAHDPSPDSPDAVTAGGPTFRLELVPQGPCWLAATVDGERVIAKLLQAGDRYTLAVNQEALLRVGEPGALSISINGQTGRPLGARGQPVSVRITKDNFREFLIS